MKYLRFIIKKYKAIKDVEISLKNNIIPIIGINESGKTSILQAILAFDSYSDNYLKGSHLIAKNRYEYDSKDHIVSAEVKFDNKEELKLFIHTIIPNRKTKIYAEFEKYFSLDKEIILSRNLDTKEYYIEDFRLNLEKSKIKEIADFILKNTPYILYFDDFTDRVPESIKFTDEYIKTDSNSSSGSNSSQLTDWHQYIEEIFFRSTKQEIDLKSFLSLTNNQDREGILSDVSDKLNEDIIEDWKKLKILNKSLKGEINDLNLKLVYELKEGFHNFYFQVIDKNFQKKARYFTINERSKGFQWFFNFAIKLKYNIKYRSDFEDAIYLLDEPGSYLHSSAQEELLRSLQHISLTNKVIYCTHSQYLLNPEIINISSIRIAERDGGAISLQNFGEYKDCNRVQGALSPLYDALHLNLGSQFNLKEKNIILTEGIIEFYLFSLIKKHTKLLSKDISIVPGSGAPNLKDLLSFAIAWTNSYALVLDSDKSGLEAFDRYKQYFGSNQSNKWILLNLNGKTKNLEIEDIFSKPDKDNLRHLTKISDLKKAIIFLFFAQSSIQQDFFQKLDQESRQNISTIVTQIQKILN